MHILIVEDEFKTATYLKKGLVENGYNVDIANDGLEGIFAALNTNYDIIVLDVMLPKVDGWSVLKKIREKHQTVPILMLTARDAIEDKVKGLELGADDYLVKPFSFSELLARVRTILRRGLAMPQPDIIQIADLEINILHHKVTRNNQSIHLSSKEFSLLVLFARRKNELLSRTIIAEQVWDMNFDSDTNIVDVAVKRLRQKIDEPFEKKLIHTARGVGYVLEDE
jgi:two-component system copper resistance phosphate regulon response regulator CusR